MTLLLGPPSSGKTTLLLALAGRLGPGLKVCHISYVTISILDPKKIVWLCCLRVDSVSAKLAFQVQTFCC
jgi:stage III sporulation protein SpoIIIAA